MPVDTEHSLYQDSSATWRRCRDVVGGRDKIIDAGELYTPKPTGMDTKQFQRYLDRGTWFGATARTDDAMSGLIFRKDPDIQLPPGQEDLVEMATADGMSLRELADAGVSNILQAARFGLLVDFPVVNNTLRTRAQAESSGDRPYLSSYISEAIINWRWGIVNNRRVLTMVVLKEVTYQEAERDPFMLLPSAQYRVLGLDELGYYQQVWTRVGDEFEAGDRLYPTMRGQRFSYIPFFVASVVGDSIETTKPPLLDLADANLGHWRNSCDLEHGAHFTCNPMPVITGWDAPDGVNVVIGSEEALIISDPQANAFYMDFDGNGLETMKGMMREKEGQMAAQGSRILLDDPKGVEAAETARIRKSGENSVLASLSGSISKVFTKAYQVAVEWRGGDPSEVSIQFNTDFMPLGLDAQSITALLGLYQNAVISKRTLYQKLQEGEAIPPGVRYEEDQELIEQEGMDDLPLADANTQ